MSYRTRLSAVIAMLVGCWVPHANITAQSAVHRGWQLNADGAIKVWIDAGSLQVIGWDRDSVDVRGTVAITSTFFGGGGHAAVKMGIETPEGKTAGPSDIVIHVPSRARLWTRSVTADIEVSAVSGALDVTSVGGRLRIAGSPTELRAESMNGSVDVTASPAYLRLKTATGNVTWTGSSDDVGVITVSGRVVINSGTVQRARFESIDGEIRFAGSVSSNANVSVDTHSGNVMLTFRKGTNASLEVSAPGCTLLGAQFGSLPNAKSTVVSKTFYQAIGAPAFAAPPFVVRSYKGYVTAVMQ